MEARGGASSRDRVATTRHVSVSWERLPGWIERFTEQHPQTTWHISPERVTAESADGTRAAFDIPLPPLTSTRLDDLFQHLERRWHIGLLLVRRGGYVVARLVGVEVVDYKVGRRHVQGRTKAGGWSQQRFARRRSNQAQAAYDAAAEHAERILLGTGGELDVLATGGDRRAVAAVLATPALRRLQRLPRREVAAYGDPNRELVARAIGELRSVRIEIVDPPDQPAR